MKKEKLQQFGHLTAGIVTMVPGLDYFERSDFTSVVLYLSLAVLFIIIAGLHKKLVQQFFWGDAAFFLLESLVIFTASRHYNTPAHQYLYYTMVAAAVIFFAFAIFSIRVFISRRERRKSRRYKTKRTGSSSSVETRDSVP